MSNKNSIIILFRGLVTLVPAYAFLEISKGMEGIEPIYTITAFCGGALFIMAIAQFVLAFIETYGIEKKLKLLYIEERGGGK